MDEYPVNNEPTPRTEAIVFLLSCFIVVVAALLSPESNPISLVLTGYTAVVGGAVVLISPRSTSCIRAFVPAIVFVSIQYISGIWGVNLNAALSYSYMFTVMLLFSMMVCHSSEAGSRTGIFGVVSVIVALVSVYGIYQYAIGFERTAAVLSEVGTTALGLDSSEIARAMPQLRYRRVFSTFMSPNVLASYLACSLPLVGYMAVSAAKAKGRIFFGLCALLGVVTILLTRSAGGFLGLVAGVLVFMVLKAIASSPALRRRILLAVFAAVVLLGITGIGIYKTRTGGELGVEKSLAERMNYWNGALELAARRPVTGYGAGSFSVKYMGLLPKGGTESRYAHNVALQTLAETGTIGFLVLVWLFGSFFRRALRGLSESRDPLFYAALAACGTAFLVHNLTDFTFYVMSGSIPFWLAYGVLIAGPGISVAGDGRHEISDARALRSVVRVLGLVLIIAFVFHFAMAHVARQRIDHAVRIMGEAGITSQAEARNSAPPQKAIELAERAVSLKPYDDGMHVFLANLYEGYAYKGGREFVRQAQREYERAIELNPEYPYHYRDLGILYTKLGETDLARDNFSKALSLYPKDQNLLKLKANIES